MQHGLLFVVHQTYDFQRNVALQSCMFAYIYSTFEHVSCLSKNTMSGGMLMLWLPRTNVHQYYFEQPEGQFFGGGCCTALKFKMKRTNSGHLKETPFTNCHYIS